MDPSFRRVQASPSVAPTAPQQDTRPEVDTATGQSTAPVQPVGQVSSSRPIGVQGSVRPGDETNALDALAADAQTLGQTGRTTAPEPVQASEPEARDFSNISDEYLQTAASGARSMISQADAQAELDRRATAAQGAADAAVDARMGGDASAAPAAGAAQALGTAMRGFGTDEEGIATALQGLGSQQEWEQVKASYDGDLLADLRSELNNRDYQRYVTDVLQAAGIQESVPARPKGGERGQCLQRLP